MLQAQTLIAVAHVRPEMDGGMNDMKNFEPKIFNPQYWRAFPRYFASKTPPDLAKQIYPESFYHASCLRQHRLYTCCS